MGVVVHIDDDTGQTYRAWFGSDSKRFVQLLLHTRFWTVLEEVFQVTTQPVTFIVAEQVVPDKLTDVYQSWEAYHASRFQPIRPFTQTLERIQAFLNEHTNWFDLLEQKWLEEEGFEHYDSDYYFTEGGFQYDLEGLLKRFRGMSESGASKICIYLL